MVTIESKFIGDFKLGDNIVYNLQILKILYDQYQRARDEEKRLLCKPIILLLASIIEAVLFDLHARVRLFTKEGVKNLAESTINFIRLKKLDDFEKYIASAKKHDLFDAADTDFYARLDEVRRLRNRIHIQNARKDLQQDDRNVSTNQRRAMTEQALEKTLKTLARKFPRDKDHVDRFVLPWNAYFS